MTTVRWIKRCKARRDSSARRWFSRRVAGVERCRFRLLRRVRMLFGGEKVGITPFKASRFAGSLPVELRLLGQPPYSATLTVEAGQVAQLDAVLSKLDESPEPEPVMPPPPPKPIVYRTEVMPRPKWRLALGGSLVGVGPDLALELPALRVDGTRIGAPCPDGTKTCNLVFDTREDWRRACLVRGSVGGERNRDDGAARTEAASAGVDAARAVFAGSCDALFVLSRSGFPADETLLPV